MQNGCAFFLNITIITIKKLHFAVTKEEQQKALISFFPIPLIFKLEYRYMIWRKDMKRYGKTSLKLMLSNEGW